MKNFNDYLNKYNSLVDKQTRLEKSLLMVDDKQINNIVQKEIDTIKNEIANLKNTKLYTQSDFDNFKQWNT